MKLILVAAATIALLVLPAASAYADPLICVDPGPTHVYDQTIDPPKVCVL